MGKGNGDDKSVKDVKKQMAFLDEVKGLAKKHGIPFQVPAGQDPLQQKRDLRVQVREQAGQVIVDFGQSISWMALSPEQATKYAATIIKIVQNIQSIKASGGEDPPAADETEKPDEEKTEVDKAE
jgi:hypothetical protein